MLHVKCGRFWPPSCVQGLVGENPLFGFRGDHNMADTSLDTIFGQQLLHENADQLRPTAYTGFGVD